MADRTQTHSSTAARRDTPAFRCRLVRALQYDAPLALPVVVDLADHDQVDLGRGTESHPLERRRDGRLVVRVETNDRRASARHARLMRNHNAWTLVDGESKNGTRLNGRRIDRQVLSDGDQIEIGNTMFVFRSTPAPDSGVEGWEPHPLPARCTTSPILAAGLAELERVAASQIPVLVRGETGTGKELTARAVHTLSQLAGDFVGVNCGAIPDTLVESHLFGHRKGAFSGAVEDRLGFVAAADRGTLFLDEIAELSKASQVALLRVLQEREVVRVGDTKSTRVAARFVAATHTDLVFRVGTGEFREDLYGRIAGFELILPPLRQRFEDLGLLIASILRLRSPERAERLVFKRAAAQKLFAHEWPLNIRELDATLHLALTIADGDELHPDHLRLRGDTWENPRSGDPREVLIRTALESSAGNVSAAARHLGYSRSHFNRLIKRYAIDPARFRS